MKKDLKTFYENNELVLIGMNDYANTSILFKNILDYVAEEIGKDGIVIDASFLTLNKVEHMNTMLEYNLSLSEIKIAQVLSLYDGVSNLFLENFGESGKILFDKLFKKSVYSLATKRPSLMDDEINIAELIHEAKAPIIIHSTGANNLMRILGTNPYVIKKDFKARNKNANYYYSLFKSKEEVLIPNLLAEIEKSFETIIAINPNSIIFSLGFYVQNVFKKKEFADFKELILAYNEGLRKLCDDYSIIYIDTATLSTIHSNHLIDFNLSRKAQKDLAIIILDKLYKYLLSKNFNLKEDAKNIGELEIKPKENVVSILQNQSNESYYKIFETQGRKKEILLQISNEKKREAKIYEDAFQLVKRRQNK